MRLLKGYDYKKNHSALSMQNIQKINTKFCLNYLGIVKIEKTNKNIGVCYILL